MHLYNAWLPPSVAEHVPDERRRFTNLVARLKEEWQGSEPGSRQATVQWVPIINMFLAVKSELDVSDLQSLVSMALKLVLSSHENLFIQHRWSQCLTRILRKYRHELVLTIEWRPLYELLLSIHFERRHSYEGYSLKKGHLGTMTTLIRRCRRYFPSGSAAEIWKEFRPALEDISHNSALEAMGFLSLLLPTPKEGAEDAQVFFTSAWVKECLRLWDALPHSNYWTLQWASLLGRCIKHHARTSVDWESFLGTLYMHYLRTFEVPVGKSGAWAPVYRRIPREVSSAFYARGSPSISTVVARSIVYLLSPVGSGQRHLDSLIDLLEQYYHPSNGGSWTSSLERFLTCLTFYFMKRIATEQLSDGSGTMARSVHFLQRPDRIAFAKGIMRLIERGQYSKNGALAAAAAFSAATLTYLEPGIVLPHIISYFQTAVDTITATHQLGSSLASLALAARPLLLASVYGSGPLSLDTSIHVSLLDCRSALINAMFDTLPGLDANDPPKTLATLRLYCAVLSSVTMLGSSPTGQNKDFPFDWSLWIDMFLSRLFSLLLNLEPPSFEPDADNGFLMDDGSHYSSVLGLLFCKSTSALYNQALRMVAKFVRTNILPGAVEEMGVLCFAAVLANPTEALPLLVEPIMKSIISSLIEMPSTGFSASASIRSSGNFKDGLSPALETTVRYQVNVLATAVTFGGPALPPYKELLKQVIAAAFDAPSSKVNEAGDALLGSVIRSLILYYPLYLSMSIPMEEHDGLEKWFSTKGKNAPEEGCSPVWHIPNMDERAFVEELLDLHLRGSLADLRIIVKDASKSSGQERERLRVVLLRLDGCVQGIGSCLPDFDLTPGINLQSSRAAVETFTVAGAAGPSIGSSALREEIADTLHCTCDYMLRDRSDDTILLRSLVILLHMIANRGTTDYSYWANDAGSWGNIIKTIEEPRVNLITSPDPLRRRRPLWLLVDRVNIQNQYRASQAGYHCYYREPNAPDRVALLLKDLLKLSLHSYPAVRSFAGGKVGKILKRYPGLIKECIPILTASLQDVQAKEETVLGACMVLMGKAVMRHLMEDWNALASFFLALLRSSHHESVKAQNAINELFLVFNIFYAGVPVSSHTDSGESLNRMSYSKMITHIQDQVLPGGSVTMHWRYNLMANGILLFLVLPPPSDTHSLYACTVTKSREIMAGGFISNLQSELPALRPLSVIALLFLLQATSAMEWEQSMIKNSPWIQTKSKVEVVISLKSALVSIMQSQGFGQKVISNLAVDHHYFEGQNSYNPQRMSDAGLTALMPTYMRDWPSTRTWDASLEGEAFSSTFARLFQYLVQECGSTAVETLRAPLEEACNEVQERGKQCIAAEIMAGLLHSDDESVVDAWDDFFGPLLRKAFLNATMESAAEWAACVRFAVGGEGRTGHYVPLLRYKILDCLVEPLPEEASTSLLTKRLTLLRAAVNELLPSARLHKDVAFQISLLNQVVTYMSHRAPQVRQGVGRIMCVLCANLLQAAEVPSQAVTKEDLGGTTNKINVKSEDFKTMVDWRILLVDGTVSAVTKIQIEGSQHLGESSSSIELYSAESKEAVRWMETVMHFLMAAVRSGNGIVLMKVLVQLLHPLLSIQETWNKELVKKAKTAMVLMRWLPFGRADIGNAVSTVLNAAKDSNWHTRVAALKFLQPLIYRHTYIISSNDLQACWECVHLLLSDPQLEVRELAATTLAGMMKGEGGKHARAFRETILEKAKVQLLVQSKTRKCMPGWSIAAAHGLVLGIAACVLSVPYDMPRWLPDMVISLARFIREPWPIRATVTKTIGEFRRTHMDTWDIQKTSFSEDQLEVLSNLTSSASYFA